VDDCNNKTVKNSVYLKEHSPNKMGTKTYIRLIFQLFFFQLLHL